MVDNYICPYATRHTTSECCIVYANWVEQTRNDRLNIITKSLGKYHCIALEALSDFETGIPKNEELEKRLQEKDVECSHIELLNKKVLGIL